MFYLAGFLAAWFLLANLRLIIAAIVALFIVASCMPAHCQAQGLHAGASWAIKDGPNGVIVLHQYMQMCMGPGADRMLGAKQVDTTCDVRPMNKVPGNCWDCAGGVKMSFPKTAQYEKFYPYSSFQRVE